jgi:hypothetical protein
VFRFLPIVNVLCPLAIALHHSLATLASPCFASLGLCAIPTEMNDIPLSEKKKKEKKRRKEEKKRKEKQEKGILCNQTSGCLLPPRKGGWLRHVPGLESLNGSNRSQLSVSTEYYFT